MEANQTEYQGIFDAYQMVGFQLIRLPLFIWLWLRPLEVMHAGIFRYAIPIPFDEWGYQMAPSESPKPRCGESDSNPEDGKPLVMVDDSTK